MDVMIDTGTLEYWIELLTEGNSSQVLSELREIVEEEANG